MLLDFKKFVDGELVCLSGIHSYVGSISTLTLDSPQAMAVVTVYIYMYMVVLWHHGR